MKTLCQCTEAGHCPRHLCEKTESEVRQCQTDWHHYHYLERKTDNLQPGDPAIDRGPVRCDVLMPYHAGSMEYVEEAVRSILNQNKADVTLHLIGDGIPSEEGLNFPGVRQYFTEKPVGPYAARMLAFDHLETDYILMADSDDIYHPNHCHYAVSCLMDTGRDLFGASMEQFVDYRDRDCEALQHTLNTFPILTSGRAESLVPDGNIVHATLAITREAFEALNGYYDSIVGADTHLVRRAAEAGYKAFISNKIVAQRRLHRTSLTNGPQYGIGTRNRKKIRNVLQSQLKQVEAGADPQQFGRLDKWRTQNKMSEVKNLAIVSCHFNPCGFKRPVENFHRYLENIGHPVTIVELSFDGQYEFDESINIRGHIERNFMWQKERLLNIGIESLPPEVDAVAWIDGDVIFENENWLEETKRLLQTHQVVQLYSHIDYLGPDDKPERSINSYVYNKIHGIREYGTPGLGWAARRDAIPEGIYDKDIVGGGDSHLIASWIKELTWVEKRYEALKRPAADFDNWKSKQLRIINSRLGVVSGTARHLYHGSRNNRQYAERLEILHRHNFDINDIRIGQNRVWEWASDKPGLHKDVADYFYRRKEDEIL